MYNKFITLLCLLLLNISYIYSANSVKCVPQLQSCLNKINQIPEAKKLIDEVLKEGNIFIKTNDKNLPDQFGAYWDGFNRIIMVNTKGESEGSLIGSILFELHNAKIQSKLNGLHALARSRKIGKEKYIEAVEHLEYVNSLEASALAKEGIKKGIFPSSAYLHTYPSFKEHFQIQKEHGHSKWIGKIYDDLIRGR